MNNPLFSSRNLFHLILTVGVLAFSTLACLAGVPVQTPVASMPTLSAGDVSPTAIPAIVQPALPERRFLTLEFPPEIRAGDADIVRLTLEVDDIGNVTPTAVIDGNEVTGEVIEIPNLYGTHHVIAEARFDIAGMAVRPTELISAPLAQGQTAVFYWSIRPDDVGTYRGTIWLYLRFVDKSNGEESRKAVSAQIVEIEAVDLLGLSADWVRATGLVGSVAGIVMGFPFFEDVVKIVFGRRKKRKK